jgi:hypothetical protein
MPQFEDWVILNAIQGGLKLSEGTSTKWIFDVEIEKLRAEIISTCREDRHHA